MNYQAWAVLVLETYNWTDEQYPWDRRLDTYQQVTKAKESWTGLLQYPVLPWKCLNGRFRALPWKKPQVFRGLPPSQMNFKWTVWYRTPLSMTPNLLSWWYLVDNKEILGQLNCSCTYGYYCGARLRNYDHMPFISNLYDFKALMIKFALRSMEC